MKKHAMFLVIIAVLAVGLTPALAGSTLNTADRSASTSAAITEYIVDGSFEACVPAAGNNSCPDWDEFSALFGSPICDAGWCGTGGGTAGPRTGTVWAWFGGAGGGGEEGTVSQSVTLPECGLAELTFYLWEGTTGSGDTFEVYVDMTNVLTVVEGDAAYTGGYALVTIDMSAYLGSTVTVGFYGSDLVAPTTNFNLDDVSLTVDDSVGCEEPAPEVPAVNFPNKGEILISAGAPVMTYGAAGNYPTGIVLPADYDGNGFDTYTVTGTATVSGETWYSVWVGGAQYLWVPASQVTVLR